MSAETSAADVDIYGDQDLTFGLPEAIIQLISGMALTEIKYDEEVQFTAEATGQDASIAALAIARKLKFSGTGSGYILDKEDFRNCKSFVDGDNTLFITKRGRAYNFKDFAKCDFTFMGAEGIAANGS